MEKLNKNKNQIPRMSKEKKVLYSGILSCLIGIIIRFNAINIAWPREWSYSGDRANTIWAIREQVIIDISLFIIAFGFILTILVIIKYLFVEND